MYKLCLCQTLCNELNFVSVRKRKLAGFSPDRAVQLWWHTKQRRPNQSVRKKYRPRSSSRKLALGPSTSTVTESASSSDNVDSIDGDSVEEQSLLDDWDDWMRESNESDHELEEEL